MQLLSVSSLYQIEKSRLYELSIAWQLPIFVSLIYVCIVTYWSRINRKYQLLLIQQQQEQQQNGGSSAVPVSNSSPFFQFIVILHNLILCVFSALVFIFVSPEIVRELLVSNRIIHTFFDHTSPFYVKILGVWAWLFYLSKYYELIDTLILLLKGKPSSFLQTFHHTGAIIGMWSLIVSRSSSVIIFVALNSFIHSLMYLYYLLTCFGYYSPWKRLLTNLQITQFAVGNPIGIFYLVSGYMADKEHPYDVLAQVLGISNIWSQNLALTGNIFYVSCLIGLFFEFSKKAYSPATNRKKAD